MPNDLQVRGLVSVIMPVFNGMRFLAASTASLLQQGGPIEIVAIDNGSEDGSQAFLADLARFHPNIILANEPQRSIAHGRNHGLRVARGEFIGFLDQDDLCPPGVIDRQRRRLAERTHLDAVFGRSLIAGEAATLALFEPYSPADLKLTILLSSGLFRKSLFDKIGAFDPSYRLADDFDLLLRIMEADCPVEIEAELSTIHRRHPNQATSDVQAARREGAVALAASLRRRRQQGLIGTLRHPLTKFGAR